MFNAKILKKYRYIAGIDEVGRGPLAGPVLAAAVVFDSKYLQTSPEWMTRIRDSKKMTEMQREKAFADIIKHAVCYGIGLASHKMIDEINILQASLMAMAEDVERCAQEPELALVDGIHKIPYIEHPQETIIQGDAKIMHIAAASILAKVIRDQMMLEYHAQYPEYGFDRHKGYGTVLHRRMIEKYGICPIHRKSFLLSS